MNITPTTFKHGKKDMQDTWNDPQPAAYTVVGGADHTCLAGISVVLLNQGVRYPRKSLFTELAKAHFDHIISVEHPGEHYDIDELHMQFPSLRFILLSRQEPVGTQINIAAAETRTPLFLVLRNDMRIIFGGAAAKIAEQLLLPSSELGRTDSDKNWYRRLCTIPAFQNAQFEDIPQIAAPLLHHRQFDVLPFTVLKEGVPSLYPYDGIGVYDRQRFLAVGGFDNGIEDSYWQLLDFGLRAWLRGEQICSTQHIRLRCMGTLLEKAAVNEDYWRFFLKNLAPIVRVHGETKLHYAHLPLKKLVPFLFKARARFRDKVRLFFGARNWVRSHQHLWKTSADALIQNWKMP